MASIDFPNSPTNGQIFNSGGKSWKYNSTKGIWQSVASTTTKNLTALDESIIPSANVTYDLGSSTNAFRDLYLSGNSIFLGAGEITSFSNGSVTLPEGSQVGGVTIGTGSGGATVYANTSLLPKVGLTAGEFAFVGNTLFITNGSGWYSVGVVNQSPELTLSTSSISLGSSGNTINFTFTATDPDGPEPTVSISNSGIANTSVANINLYTANSTVTVDNFSGDPYNATITLTATDGINQTSASVTLTVSYLSGVWDETVLSIGTSSTNSLDNSTFIDRSTNAHTVTATGSPVQTAFHPYLDNWSVEFDGSGDYLTVPSDASFAYGTADFTWEFFIYLRQSVDNDYIIDHGANGGTLSIAGSTIRYYNTTIGTGNLLYSGVSLTLNKWNHVALTRQSGTTNLFVDGVLGASSADAHNYSEQTVSIGRYGSGTFNFVGALSNLRLVKGTSLYTSNFTPPTEKLTAVSGTSLLTCQSNRFIDNSSNDHSITVSGDPKVSALNPFGQGSEYAVGENKGSTYLSGSSKVDIPLVTALNAGTDSYSFELWVYFNSTNVNQGVIGTSSDGFAGFERSNGTWAYYQGSSATNTGVSASLYQWHHVVICRNGSSGAFFVDGQRLATFTDTGDKTNRGTFNIGYNGVAGGAYTIGYISDYRYVIGSNPYDVTQTTLTVPTAPVGNTNASLYLPMDNAGIFDKTGNHTLTPVGDASTSTTQTKFADTAVYFDGTGDYLSGIMNRNIAFGTEDMTIECWVYANSLSGIRSIFDTRQGGTSFGSDSFAFSINSGIPGTSAGSYSTTTRIVQAPSTINLSTWVHIAVTRENGTNRLFIDGISVDSNTRSWNQTFTDGRAYYIGQTVGFDRPFNGYIENLQFLKGVAKYTTNFTVPDRTQGRTYQAES